MITDLWYKNAIIYSLDLETFMDGNGDGCGDFRGLMQRLDYLDTLGVDVIWLAPFQPSPNRDNGYDISDYYGVDPRHGSSGEFVEFMNQANKRGIAVIMDLVVNHTSDQHPWFQEARRDANSAYRDLYIWSKKRPAGWNKGMVFPGVQKAVWTRDPRARRVLLSLLLRFPARPEHGQSAGAQRDPAHHGLLAAAGRRWVSRGRRAVRHPAHRRLPGANQNCISTGSRRCAAFCNGVRATLSCSAKPMCCRETRSPTSARTAKAST